MPYSDFSLESACQAFSLGLDVVTNLFDAIPTVRAGARLLSLLDDYVPMATSIHTEKARSEFIVAPILADVRRLMDRRISLFSGVNFEVDKAHGLDGICDFILSNSNNQLFVTRPVLMIVEAKNDNIKAGLGQCAAEMVAALLQSPTWRRPVNHSRGRHDGERVEIPQTGRGHALHGSPRILSRSSGQDPGHPPALRGRRSDQNRRGGLARRGPSVIDVVPGEVDR